MAESFGAVPVHLTEDDSAGRVKELTEGRGVDLAVDAVGHPDALDLACRLARKAGTVSVIGVYAERAEVHMGVVWIKALKLAHRPRERDRPPRPGARRCSPPACSTPAPLVTHRMSLDDAPEAYAIYDRREALKIVLRALRAVRPSGPAPSARRRRSARPGMNSPLRIPSTSNPHDS